MDGIGTHGVVRDRLKEFMAVRDASLAQIAPLSQPQLDFSAGRGRWSIGEIADHLRLSELLWRGEIRCLVDLARAGKPAHLRRSFSDLNVSPAFIPDAVLPMFEIPFGIMTRFMPDAVASLLMEFPILPIRNPDVGTPRAGRPAGELMANLRAGIDETRQLIEANGDLDFEQMTSSHPLMGTNNVAQMLTLLARHERRHHVQMDRVRSEAGFPGR